MQTVLFVLRTKASLLENFPIAHALQHDGVYHVAFLVDPGYAHEHVPMIIAEGFCAFNPSGKELFLEHEESVTSIPYPKKSASLKERLFNVFPSMLKNFLLYRSQLKRVRAFLQNNSIALVILSGDRALGWETSCIKAANEQGISTLVTPYAIQFLESIAECRIRRSDYKKRFAIRGPLRLFTSLIWPKWAYKYEGNAMLYYPADEAIPAAILGLMPKNPWTLGGGQATKLAVESEYAKQIFLHDGVADAKMVVTGKPCVDSIAVQMDQQSTHSLRRELGIPPENRVLLCSLPQLGEHGLISWEEHWSDIDWMLNIFGDFRKKGITTVISLHPKCAWEDYKPRCDAVGAIVAPQRIYNLFTISDVFTAAVSSTVTQAIATHIPCVVEDCHQLDKRGYYDTAPGVIMVRDKNDYKDALEKVLFNDSIYAELKAEQINNGSNWALLDGKCTERMIQAIYSLIEDALSVSAQ